MTPTLTFDELEKVAKEKGCPLYVIVDEMVNEYFKKQEPVKTTK
jgi:hypothetical protein